MTGQAQPTPSGSGQGSTSNQGGQPSTSSQSRKSTTPSQGGKSSTPHQSSKPASTSGGGIPAASGGPVNPPPGRGGVGDSTWTDWYQMVMRGAGGRISEPQGPPCPIGMAKARREAVGQIYDRVNGKEPPSHNIISEALWAYYTRVDPLTRNTWACQILCMITEYHMACVTSQYCQGNSRIASCHWLTAPLQRIDQALLTSGSGIIGPGLDASGCMVLPTRHGPQQGACLLWIPSQVPTLTRTPLGLLPRPRDYLGATV